MLTGEAEAVLKHSDKIGQEVEVGIGHRKNMVLVVLLLFMEEEP